MDIAVYLLSSGKMSGAKLLPEGQCWTFCQFGGAQKTTSRREDDEISGGIEQNPSWEEY